MNKIKFGYHTIHKPARWPTNKRSWFLSWENDSDGWEHPFLCPVDAFNSLIFPLVTWLIHTILVSIVPSVSLPPPSEKRLKGFLAYQDYLTCSCQVLWVILGVITIIHTCHLIGKQSSTSTCVLFYLISSETTYSEVFLLTLCVLHGNWTHLCAKLVAKELEKH